jgi:hypothetical protein
MSEIQSADDYEAWYTTHCPYCSTLNWHNNGNEQDITTLDVDSVKCWRCGLIYWFGPPPEYMPEIHGKELPEPENTAEGLRDP